MTSTIEIIKTDAEGNILEMQCVQRPEMFVTSAQIIPKGMRLGARAFVVDKMAVAVCAGDDNWYREPDKPVAAGQPFSALFA